MFSDFPYHPTVLKIELEHEISLHQPIVECLCLGRNVVHHCSRLMHCFFPPYKVIERMRNAFGKISQTDKHQK